MTRSGVGAPSKTGRRAVAGQIGRDHAMGGRQRGDRVNPLRAVGARAVQQDDRRATARFEHGRRDAIQSEAPLFHRQRGEQSARADYAVWRGSVDRSRVAASMTLSSRWRG